MSAKELVPIACYVAAVPMALLHARAPAWFWTMLMPLLPAAIVVMGFHAWRRVCPLAAIGSIGARFWGGTRLPAAWRRLQFTVPFLLLVGALLLRHTWMNGDGAALAAFLTVLALFAIVVNAVFGGKTWCNYLCPVAFVERVYTDGTWASRNSRCAKCTGCKSACPDIDQEHAYRRELASRSRRWCTYAFPGVVWGFYWYFCLRGGDWSAFFDGAWTSRPASAALGFGPGFHFAPEVPAPIAVLATFAVSSTLSLGVFAGLEAWLHLRLEDRPRATHSALSAAAFVAFSIFYVFAGAPALSEPIFAWPARLGTGLVIGALVLRRRLARRSEPGGNVPRRSPSGTPDGEERRSVVLGRQRRLPLIAGG